MLGRSLLGAGVHRRAARLFSASIAVAGFGAVGGCLTRPIAPIEPHTTSTVVEQLRQSSVDKIDLVLVVDNSASMADKQAILALAVPDLLTGLVNPQCLDAQGTPAAVQPAGPLDKCPSGSDREFPPVLDIHIGVLSSSLGSFGDPHGCPTATWGNPTMNDAGHLITRADATNPAKEVATYQNERFLAWDPAQKLRPAGEASLANLKVSLQNIVIGDGQLGCGYESQNESWYRFLVDPTPYGSITFDGQVHTDGKDGEVSTERNNFLRPDSLLAIINVTDETDTSVKEYSGYPIITDGTPLKQATAACAKSLDDPCCTSCGVNPMPMGCPPDPTCAEPFVDNPSIHAFGLVGHKQRYGVEFFYPPSRYVQALTDKTVTGRDGKTYPNPIYAGGRDPSLVFYAAITGVPWQLIARQQNGKPDLTLGFKSSKELGETDAEGHPFWDDIIGDPEHYVAPRSPFMKESWDARAGVDPVTGISVSPTSGPDNEINGHERGIDTSHGPGDIQYACTFPILQPLDGTKVHNDCIDDVLRDQNPLCAANPHDIDPSTSMPRHTLQVKAKAYPGLRNLAIARGLGDQGIAASICAAKLCDPTDPSCDATTPDFGYRPAMRAIIDRLKTAIGGECLPLQLTPDAAGQVPCLVLEAHDTAGAACTCDGPALQAVQPGHEAAVEQVMQQQTYTASDCFCEVKPTTGAALASCQNDLVSSDADGWCYVDEAHGNPALVDRCPASEQHQIRFVGAAKQSQNGTLFISCEKD